MRPASHSLPRQVVYVLAGTGAILLAPLAAMQFTDEVRWSAFDFIVAALLLSGAGLLYVLLARSIATRGGRIGAACALFTLLLIVWAELAVGVFGSRFAGS